MITVADGYQAGVCNIGPAEIRRRRRTGHVGLIATVGLAALLIAGGAPPLARLLVGAPAMLAASGYLQAHLRFCAAYGTLGLQNFGEAGEAVAVADADARARDRARSRQIGLASFGIGAAVGVLAALLPL